MFSENDLEDLGKDELIQIIISFQEENKEFKEQLGKLGALLRQWDNPHTPSSKKRFRKNTKKGKKRNRGSEEKKLEEKDSGSGEKWFPGREEGHLGAGINLPEPDRVVEHRINQEGWEEVGDRTKTIIDLVDDPLLVTEHVIHKYRGPEGNVVEVEADLPGGVYGKNLQAFVCLLKGKLGASYQGMVVWSGRSGPISPCPPRQVWR